MRNTALIMNDGINYLLEKLGALETEAFISNILKEPSDYTKWSKNLYSELSLHELNSKAAEFVKNNYEKPTKVNPY
jgi:hypothetical protein